MIQLGEVKFWMIDAGIGHIVTGYEHRWTHGRLRGWGSWVRTPHSVDLGAKIQRRRPPRICRRCRAALKDLTPKAES